MSPVKKQSRLIYTKKDGEEGLDCGPEKHQADKNQDFNKN